MPEIVRTFVAVQIPVEVQDRAGELINRLKVAPAKVKWVAPRHLHWTLKFLGDVDLREIPEVCDVVAQAVRGFAPFDIETRGAGTFPDLERPRTVWLGVGRGKEQMIALHAAVEQGLGRLGFREEHRKFRPHVTIGRVRNSTEGGRELGELLTRHADFDAGLSTVYEVVVLSSDLGAKGPTYEPLGHAELLAAE